MKEILKTYHFFVKTCDHTPNMSIIQPKAPPRCFHDAPKAPRTTQGTSKISPRCSQDDPRLPQDDPRRSKTPPRRPQDASKHPQDASKTPPRRPKSSQDAPRRLQSVPRCLQDTPRQPRTFPRRLLARFWSSLRHIFNRFCKILHIFINKNILQNDNLSLCDFWTTSDWSPWGRKNYLL